ncbi:hypothetical protein HK097_001481, partial [Rhizophlyctis rosea]
MSTFSRSDTPEIFTPEQSTPEQFVYIISDDSDAEVVVEKKGKSKVVLSSEEDELMDVELLFDEGGLEEGVKEKDGKREERVGKREMTVLEAMQNELSCSVCFEIFEDARRTPCDHVYCRTCIQGALEKFKNCPLCGQDVQPSQLTAVLKVQDLADHMRRYNDEPVPPRTSVTANGNGSGGVVPAVPAVLIPPLRNSGERSYRYSSEGRMTGFSSFSRPMSRNTDDYPLPVLRRYFPNPTPSDQPLLSTHPRYIPPTLTSRLTQPRLPRPTLTTPKPLDTRSLTKKNKFSRKVYNDGVDDPMAGPSSEPVLRDPSPESTLTLDYLEKVIFGGTSEEEEEEEVPLVRSNAKVTPKREAQPPPSDDVGSSSSSGRRALATRSKSVVEPKPDEALSPKEARDERVARRGRRRESRDEGGTGLKIRLKVKKEEGEGGEEDGGEAGPSSAGRSLPRVKAVGRRDVVDEDEALGPGPSSFADLLTARLVSKRGAEGSGSGSETERDRSEGSHKRRKSPEKVGVRRFDASGSGSGSNGGDEAFMAVARGAARYYEMQATNVRALQIEEFGNRTPPHSREPLISPSSPPGAPSTRQSHPPSRPKARAPAHLPIPTLSIPIIPQDPPPLPPSRPIPTHHQNQQNPQNEKQSHLHDLYTHFMAHRDSDPSWTTNNDTLNLAHTLQISTAAFTCPACNDVTPEGQGIKLASCGHLIC